MHPEPLMVMGYLIKTNWEAVIRVYDAAANVIETHEQAGEFKEP